MAKNCRNNFTLMKDMAIHTRVNPKERMDRLTNFANRLLNTPDVSYFHFILILFFAKDYFNLFITTNVFSIVIFL